MFAVVNLARHLKVNPETALRAANAKFERRFASIERALAAQGKAPSEATLAEMDALWNEAKAAEKPAENPPISPPDALTARDLEFAPDHIGMRRRRRARSWRCGRPSVNDFSSTSVLR